MPDNITWPNILLALGICAAVGLTGAVTMLVVAFQQVRGIDIPPDADFFGTLQLIPISVPLALDFLDLAFDVFSAPISWVVLEMLGLRSLQMVTVFESLIPGTQLIPTLTVCWFVARGMRNKDADTPFRSALRGYQAQTQGRYGSLGRGKSALSMANKYRGADLLPSGELPDPPDAVEGDIIDDGADDFGGDYAEEEGGGD
jgi:hypothetical protein